MFSGFAARRSPSSGSPSTQASEWTRRRPSQTVWVGICALTLVAPPPGAAVPRHTSGLAAARAAEGTEIYKRLSLEDLMNIEVTSVSKRPESLSSAAASIQVITAEEIRRSGATNLPEVLRLADNLEVAQKGAHEWTISARGFNTALANKLLVLMDGRTLYTPLFSGVFWEQQDYLLEDIERIEIISGPGGTMWGANAVNGVINIITKSAVETAGTFVEVGGGDQLRLLGGARYGAALGSRAHYRIFGKYSERNEESLADGYGAEDDWSMASGGFRVDVSPTAEDLVAVSGQAYSGDQGLRGRGDARVDGGHLLARWTRTESSHSEWSVQAFVDRTHLVTPTPALIVNGLLFAPAGTFRDTLETVDLEFQHRQLLAGRHEIVWGGAFRSTQDEVANAPSLGFFPQELKQRLYSLFLQDSYRVREGVIVTAGTKVEHNDYTGLELEPSLRLSWALAEDRGLWAAISRAVRTPSRIDRDVSQPVPPYLVVLAGGAEFASETVIAYEAGYRQMAGDRIALSAAVFWNEYDHVRSTSFTPSTILPFFFENNLEGETWGLELAADFDVNPWWRLHGGYDYFREELRVKAGKSDFNEAHNETADPRHQFLLRSAMDLRYGIEVDGALRWVDAIEINDGPTVGKVPSYFELDLKLAWRPNDSLELALVGRNLLHARHPEYGFPGPGRGEIRRSILGKVAWRL